MVKTNKLKSFLAVAVRILAFLLICTLLYFQLGKKNISLNGKDLIVSKLEILKETKVGSQLSDTSNKEQLTGDFRYDYLFK